MCIIEGNKKECLLLKGRRSNKVVENEKYIALEQNKQNIINEMKKLAKKIGENEEKIFLEPQIIISKENERRIILTKLLEGKDKINQLLNIYRENELLEDRKFIFYTDGSLTKDEITTKQTMGIGWLRVKEKEHDSIINQFRASNVGWPSSTKAEILAIYTAILTTIDNSEITIFTDSKSAINQFNLYEKEYSQRKKYKSNQKLVWGNIFYLIKKCKLSVKLIKIKAHDGIWGNEKADELAKGGVEDKRLTTKNFEFNNDYHLIWYNHKVEKNSRKFLGMLNEVDREIEELNLKRMKDKEENFDKNITLAVLNNNREISEDNDRTRSKFLTLKENKRKSFKYKLLIGELPVIENLKRRLPKIYKENLLCVRCNKKKGKSSTLMGM